MRPNYITGMRVKARSKRAKEKHFAKEQRKVFELSKRYKKEERERAQYERANRLYSV